MEKICWAKPNLPTKIPIITYFFFLEIDLFAVVESKANWETNYGQMY